MRRVNYVKTAGVRFVRFRQVHYYDEKGADLYDAEPAKDFSPEWSKVIPDSANEKLYNPACTKPAELQE